jgi:hypothetical protein
MNPLPRITEEEILAELAASPKGSMRRCRDGMSMFLAMIDARESMTIDEIERHALWCVAWLRDHEVAQ